MSSENNWMITKVELAILAKDSWSLTLIPRSSNTDALGPSQPRSETQELTTFLHFLL